VDAGDLFLPRAALPEGFLPADEGEVDRRARLLLEGLRRVGLHAFVPGEADLRLGLERLKGLLGQYRTPVVCANLLDRAGRRPFDADRIVPAKTLKVGIFGLLIPPPEDADALRAVGLRFTDPEEAARVEVASLRKRGADLVVALAHLHGGNAAARALAEKAPGIDFIVLGHEASILDAPDALPSGTSIVAAYEMGKYLGRLDLHVLDGKLRFADRGRRAQLREQIESRQRQIEDLKKRAAEEGGAAGAKDFWTRQIELQQEVLARDRSTLAALPATVQGSWLENRVTPLDTAFPDHPGLAPLVLAYNQENARRGAAGRPVGIQPRPQGVAAPTAGMRPAGPGGPEPAAPVPELTFAGTFTCGNCHEKALAFWKKTKHAHAMETLAKKGRAADPTCIGCHVTGYLQAGGPRDVKVATGRFGDVGCESCHGPGLAHIVAEGSPAKRSSTKRKVEATTCLGCHTPDQTNKEFDYALFLRAIVGPGHGAP
jgi:hypothetical protein